MRRAASARAGARHSRSGSLQVTTSALAEQQPLLATLETASMCAFGRGVPAAVRSLLRVYADELPT